MRTRPRFELTCRNCRAEIQFTAEGSPGKFQHVLTGMRLCGAVTMLDKVTGRPAIAWPVMTHAGMRRLSTP